MRGHEPIITMRKQGVKPLFVYVDDVGADTHWHRYGATPNVEITANESLEMLDLRWAVGLDIRASINGVDRAKDVFYAFQRVSPKRVICTACELVETNGRTEPVAVESMDTDEVIQWQK